MASSFSLKKLKYYYNKCYQKYFKRNSNDIETISVENYYKSIVASWITTAF